MSKLENALGYVSGGYIDDALNFKPKRTKKRLIPMLAAALAAVLMLSAAAFGMQYYVPGIGITPDSSLFVLSADRSARLGSAIVDTLLLTDDGRLYIWVYDEAENHDTLKSDDYLTVEIDGRVYTHSSYGYSISQHWSGHIFEGIPVCERLTVSCHGESTELTLSKPKGAEIRSASVDDCSVALLGVSDSGSMFAGEFRDDFLYKFSEGASSVDVHVTFETRRTDGENGTLSGFMPLYGRESNYNDILQVNAEDVGCELESAKLLRHQLFCCYDANSALPEAVVTMPELGETVECDILLFERMGLYVQLKSITNNNGILEAECRFGPRIVGGEAFMQYVGLYHPSFKLSRVTEEGLSIVRLPKNDSIYTQYPELGDHAPIAPGSELRLRVSEVSLYCPNEANEIIIDLK